MLQSIDFTAFSAYRMQNAPANEQYFYHYHILSFLCTKIMLCKRCKQGVKQALHTHGTAYLSHSWHYSQILPWQPHIYTIFVRSYGKTSETSFNACSNRLSLTTFTACSYTRLHKSINTVRRVTGTRRFLYCSQTAINS